MFTALAALALVSVTLHYTCQGKNFTLFLNKSSFPLLRHFQNQNTLFIFFFTVVFHHSMQGKMNKKKTSSSREKIIPFLSRLALLANSFYCFRKIEQVLVAMVASMGVTRAYSILLQQRALCCLLGGRHLAL